MKMPVDMKAVFESITELNDASEMPVSLALVIDESAPFDLIHCIREACMPTDHASVHVCSFDQYDHEGIPSAAIDLAIVVAALDQRTGSIVDRLHNEGIPSMIVTTMPELVQEIAQEESHPLLSDDVVAPDPSVDGSSLPETDDANLEPYPLTIDRQDSLFMRMGQWVVDVYDTKRLAFALSFPFVRKPLAIETVVSTSVQNAGIGLVVVLPGADLPLMTLNQAKMVLRIAAAYGQPLGVERAKELLGVVGGAFACRSIARELTALIPAIGWGIKAAIGYSGTIGMGFATIAYFEEGHGTAAQFFEGVRRIKIERARLTAAASTESSPRAALITATRVLTSDVCKGAIHAAQRSIPVIHSAASTLYKTAGTSPQVVRSMIGDCARYADSLQKGRKHD